MAAFQSRPRSATSRARALGRAGAATLALLALGGAAGAKGPRSGAGWNDLASAQDASAEGAKNVPGRISPGVRAELRANPQNSKSILVKHRLDWCDSTEDYLRRNPQARLQAMDGRCVIEGPPDTPAVRNAAIPNAKTPWKTLRVAFHMFTNDDGSQPTSSQTDIQGGLDQLNMDYAPGRIRFVNAGIYVHKSTRFREPKDVDGEIVAMKRAYALAPARQINVYIFEAQTAQETLLGRGTFTWDSDALGPQGGFFCDNNAFGLGKRTATHEFGHCLGLWHPFHGVEEVSEDGCGGCRELVGRTPAQGDATGDFCSDTPPTSRNFNCGPPTDSPQTPDNEAVDKCSGKPYGATDFHNYMGYADDDCINRFTPQQYGRMHAWINYKLKSWMVGTGPTDPPVVESTTPSGRVISLVPSIGATFSQPMSKATVQASLRIVPAVRGAFTWSADARSFTFRPSAPLLSGSNYSIQLLGSAKSATGKPLDGNYNGRADAPTVDAVSWGFRTAGGPSNDKFARAQVLAGARGSVEGSNQEATKEPGEPNHSGSSYDRGGASVWYRWTAPTSGIVTFDTQGSNFDTVLGAYEGTAVGALRAVENNDDIGDGNLASAVSLHVDAGNVVYFAIDGARADNGVPAQGHIQLNWSTTPAPSNDLFARAQIIGGPSGSALGNNSGAWSEDGEPSHAYSTPNSSIWYRWTAPASGMVTFNTEGSQFDTVLAVYTGTAVGALSQVASDDDSGSGTLSSVSFSARAGVAYSIAINGSGSSNRGAAKLSWGLVGAPPNDDFAQRQVLGGSSGQVAGSNVGATAEEDEGSAINSYRSAVASVWYQWTAPSSGTATFSTAGSSFDTVLGVYAQTSSGYDEVGSDDDDGGAKTSTVTFDAVAGTVYVIVVDSYSSSSARGSIALGWSLAAPSGRAKAKAPPPSTRSSEADRPRSPGRLAWRVER